VQGFRARGPRSLVLVLSLAALLTPAVAQARDPITPLSAIHSGLHCTALTVVQGTTISSFDIDVLDVVAAADGQGPRILVRVSGPAVDATGIAEGFSGSPVYCPDANGQIGNAGAISETVGQYGESVGLVTPIESMLGLRVHPPDSVRSAPKLLRSARPLASPLVVAGLAPPLARLLQREATAKKRAVATAPAGPLGTFAPQPLVPGASVSVMLSTGAIAAGGIGTVTYRDGPILYAFGHPMDEAGRRALMLGDAYVFTVIGNPLDVAPVLTSYKLAAPGHVLGTLTNDALDGIVGTVGSTPRSIPVTVTVRDRDRHRTLRQRTDVADETDVGNPAGASALNEIAPVAIAQAVTVAFNGAPAEETGQLCLHIHVREQHALLHFCKRYVVAGAALPDLPPALGLTAATDAGRAFTYLDLARFARLHVTSVDAGVTIERGLRLATMLDARGPRKVRPGHTARIALEVRVARGRVRTIRFRIAIPRDAPAGLQTLRLSGTDLQGNDSSSSALDSLFSVFFSEGGGPEPPPAQSMDDLASSISDLADFDGVSARLGGERWPAYRDGHVRIDGDAAVTVRVAGHHKGGGDDGSGIPPAIRQLLGL
jgi:hypothetical protein